MATIDLRQGDCLDVFREVRGLRAIVSDLPAGIGFMGRHWDRPPAGSGHRASLAPRSREHERRLQDRDAFVGYWAERLAVAYDACADDAVALVWAIPRTHGWTSRALEDAGWRVVDAVSHLFGQGWPKGPAVLKPAREDWIVGVKGRGALDVEACRVPRGADSPKPCRSGLGYGGGNGADYEPNPAGSRPANVVLSHAEGCQARGVRRVRGSAPASGPTLIGPSTSAARGKFNGTAATPSYGEVQDVPAYDCLAGCDCGASWLAPAGGPAPRCACGRAGWWACPVAEVDALSGDGPGFQGGTLRRGATTGKGLGYGSAGGPQTVELDGFADSGGASRFYNRFGYYAKCPSGERHAGCSELYWAADPSNPFGFRRVTREAWAALPADERADGNVHPTVKRIALMRWLHALVGGGPIGDLCAGSGSGAIAAHLDGIDWIGSEVCPEAIEIAQARLAWWRGLAPSAVAEFLRTDTMPATAPGQLAMFGSG